MKITIITTTYNSAATLDDTLTSVAAQSYRDFEHIVVDGGSTDDTLSMIERHVNRFPDHPLSLKSERDGGIYDAMNKGLARATGDVVGFLNSDDCFEDADVLGRIAGAFRANPVDAVYGDLVLVNQKDMSRVVRYWRSGPYEPGSCARSGWMPPHPTFYARRDILNAEHGFNTEYRLQADLELIMRLLEIKKISMHHIPHILVRMRMGGATTGSVKNIVKGNIESLIFRRRLGFGGAGMFMVRRVSHRVKQLFSRPSSPA